MWQLSPEQATALAKLQHERDMQRMGQCLAQAFPSAAERVGERFGDLIALAVQRGRAHGLTHMLALGRYLACWFAFGAEFELKPAFSWAQAILAQPGLEQGAKVYQLCHRTQEELNRLARPDVAAPGVIDGTGFAQAMIALDAALRASGDLGALQRGQVIRLGNACDIDAVDLRHVDGKPTQLYRNDQGQWRRVTSTVPGLPIALKAGVEPTQGLPATATLNFASAASLPGALHLIGAADGSRVAQLRLRLHAAASCNAAVHPLVSLKSPQAFREWRGDDAKDLRLILFSAPPTDSPADGLQPTIAAEGAPLDSLLSMSSCGLRDNGQPLGVLSTRVAVYPGQQHLMAWRREADPSMSWPETGAAITLPAARVRIERDGTPMDVVRWQQGLDALDRQLMDGLRRLATAWERESGIAEGRVQAEPRVLAGTAALTWGWAESPNGMASPPHFRIAGQLDLIACQLDMRLTGNLALQGSLSNVSLRCSARELLTAVWDSSAAATDALQALQVAQCSFRQPFVLALDVVAQPDAAVLGIAGPVGGALVGSCGLRPRADGAGLQWFAKLNVEPVSVPLHWHDPLLGQQTIVQPLLPALKLVDWSLG